jgi:putative ABC transport system permease protein
MFQSYLNTAFRSMLRNKTSTLISVGGLALGMCCALLIFLYIQFELSFDAFHKKQDLIYRVLVKGEKQNREIEYRSSIVHELVDKLINDSVLRDSDPESIANEQIIPHKKIQRSKRLEKTFPRFLRTPTLPGSHYITDAVRMSPQSGTVRYKEHFFAEDYFYFTEPAVFRMFDFPLQKGSVDMALAEPGSIVLTQEIAEKYFAGEDPLGQIVRFEQPSKPPLSFKVTGVLKPIPQNSSMRVHFLATFPFEDLQSSLPQWQPLYTYTYIEFGGVKRRRRPTMFRTLLQDLFIWDKPIHVAIVANDFKKELEKIRIPDFYADHFYTDWHFTIEPFQNTYFAEDRLFTSFTGNHVETLKKGNKLSVQLLFLLAIIILAISCINVVNLSTARSAGRAREIAIRKVMGADRIRLISQFLIESTLLSFLSLVLALSLVELLLPSFNHMLHRELATDYAHNWGYLLAIAGIALTAGFFSGIYPAFFLSSFPAMETMKGANLPASKKLRKWLMVFQITGSVCILIFTLFLSRESSFLRNKHPGFLTEDIIFFKIDKTNPEQTYLQFKKDLLNIPGVSHVTASSLAAWEYGITGLSSFSFPDTGQNADKTVQARLLLVDPDFLRLFEIPVVNGKDFYEASENPENYCIINQTALKIFNQEATVGKKIQHGEKSVRQIQGVARDFHYNYPWQKIEPLIIISTSEYYGLQRPYISVRLLSEHTDQTIDRIGNTFQDFFPESIFSYRYVKKELDRIHQKMNYHWEMIMKFASAAAIFLAALGLAGFAEYEAERKTKEIGIRKALGATRMQICVAFVQQFIPMVLAANVIACVFSYLLIPKWLHIINYPWPFHMGLPVFIYSCSLTLLTSLLIVSFQIFRASSVDPADALRDE